MDETRRVKRIRVLGSHWNRTRSRDVGTGVVWDNVREKWRAVVVRNLGEYETATEASLVLDKHLEGVEKYFLDELENGDGASLVMGIKGIE